MNKHTQITMFGADWCRDCRRAKAMFEHHGVAYTYVDLVKDEAAVGVAHDISGRTNIPVIVYPDESYQVEPSNADITAKLTELGFIQSPARDSHADEETSGDE